MKYLPGTSGLLAALAVFSLAAVSGPNAPNGTLSDRNLRYIGRWDRSNPTVYHSYWTGAYLRTAFTGTAVKVKLASGTDLSVSIDGEPLRDVHAASGETDLAAGPLKPGVHSLLVASQGQNFEVPFQGLTLNPGASTRPTPAKPIIEFVGDSISAGVRDNYCWLTGEALGCDHIQIAFSARALTSGYGCADDKTGLDVQYFRLKNFNHLDEKPPVPWDFSYTPQVVVINLGQNDQCGGEPDTTMTASYIRFLKAIRAKLPQTQIVALRPFGGPYADAERKAIEELTTAGDKRVHDIDTTGWLDKEDFRDGIHPNERGNAKVTRRLAPLLRPLLGFKASVPAATTVGDPKNPTALSQQVQDAYNGGARHIVIRPGAYLLPKVGRTVFNLDGWQDATISAYGVTLIMQDSAWTHDLFDFTHCAGVTLQGPTLSQSEITSYQGRVVAVGHDDAGKAYCDWRPDKGYPIPPADATKFPGGANVVDARTRLLKIGNGDFWSPPMESRGDNTFRVHFGGPTVNFGPGDWLVGRYGDASFKVFLDHSRGCTIKDVTLLRNGFSPIREDGGGGNRILHCRWTLGPRPAGATEDPLVSGAADGLHSTGANPGPDIERCVFEGVILDDCLAVHGSLQTVKSAAGNALTVENGGAHLAVGGPVRISSDKGFFAEATVVALKDNGDKTMTVTLDKALDVPAGAKLSNPQFNGPGCRIIGCRLGNTRSRGILLKGDNDLVQGNIIEGCGMAGVSLGPEYYWGEADYVKNVTVAGNTFLGNGKSGYGGGAVLIHGDGAVGNRDIVIRNNRFLSNLQGDIDVSWTDGVTLTGNVITGAPAWPASIAPQSVLSLSNSRAVTLSGNVVRNPSVYKSPIVAIGKNVTDLTHNDQSGIRTSLGEPKHPFSTVGNRNRH